MKILLAWIGIAFGIVGGAAGQSSAPRLQTLNDKISDIALTSGVETIGGASIEDAVAQLRHLTAFPVSFESVEVDKVSSGLTLSAAVATLHRLRQTQELSPPDEMRLKAYEQLIADGKDPSELIGFKKKAFTLVARNMSVWAFLDRLMLSDDSYTWKNDGTDDAPVVVIQPRSTSVLDWNVRPVCGSLAESSLARLFGSDGKLTMAFQAHGVSLGPMRAENRLPDAQINLCQEGLSARDVLDSTIKAAGHDWSWSLSGIKGLRWLTFQK